MAVSARAFWIGIVVAALVVAGIVTAIVLAVRSVNNSGSNTIRVVAEDEDAQALANATVTATRSSIGGASTDAKAEAAQASGASSGATQASGTTNGRGIWQQAKLASGNWTIQVSKDDFQPQSASVPVSGDGRADKRMVVEGWSITKAYEPLRLAVETLADGDASLNVTYSFVNTNTTLDAEGRTATSFTDADSSVNET